jgi:hypothetical protein
MKVDLNKKEDMMSLIHNPIKIACGVKRLVCYMDFEAQAIQSVFNIVCTYIEIEILYKSICVTPQNSILGFMKTSPKR